MFRAVWPLALAATADGQGAAVRRETRGTASPGPGSTAALLGYAEAVLAGRAATLTGRPG